MILDRIIEQKKKEIEKAKTEVSLAQLQEEAFSFVGRLRDFKKAVSQTGKINLIAEIKGASPSQGLLRKDFDPAQIARIYQSCGACAVSILTDKEFFHGSLEHVHLVRKEVSLPILRKDFIIDKYQIYESICAGADSVLLIARILSVEQLSEFSQVSRQIKLEPVCEVHSEEDLDKVLAEDAQIIGINNRDLDTFKEDLRVSARLIKRIPKDKIVISESGIKRPEDVEFLQKIGVNTVLIGEAFIRSRDIAAKIKELMRGQG